MKPCCLALLVAALACAQSRPDWIHERFENLDFATGAVGQMPPGWRLGAADTPAYAAEIAAGTSCATGKPCAIVRSMGLGPHEQCFLYQNVDATPYRGKALFFVAGVRVAGGGQARLLVRVHRQDNSTSFFNNMGDHPITSAQWSAYRIGFPIDAEARDIEFGVQLFGEGAVWFDQVSVSSPLIVAENAIRELFRQFTEARAARDGHAMAELYSEDAEYINAFNRARVKGRSKLEQMWSGVQGKASRTIHSIDVLTPDMALLRVDAEFDDPSQKLEETLFLVTEDGEWKIRMHQAMLP